MRFSLPTGFLFLVLTACNLAASDLPTPNVDGDIFVTATAPLPTANAEGVIIITATPEGALPVSQVSTSIVLQTAAPTLTAIPPTPIPDPQELLAQADQQLRNGFFEEAVGSYQAILAQGDRLSPELRAEAAFKLGQTAVREGLFDAAVDALTLLVTELPDDPQVPQAYFLRGDAYLGLSQWDAAIADFQRYLRLRPGLIDSYAFERIADAQLALGQTEPALASYQQALDANRILVPQLILREKVAQILISIGRVEEAVAQYDAILAVAQNAPYRASIELAAAEALIDGTNGQVGLPRAQRVFDTYNDTASAFPAMQLLLENGVTINGLRRGRVYFQHGDYLQAIEAFNEYTSNFQLDAIPADLYLLLGRAYREIGNSDAALVAFQTLIEQYPTDPLFGEALLERGRTRFLANEIPTAIETYLAIARDFPGLIQTAAEAMWRAGFLYGTRLEDFTSSRQTFTELANTYPNTEWARSGLSIAASVAVANGETAVAENLYGRIASLSSGQQQASAYYWVGRLAQQRGDEAGAARAFELAQQAAPDSFFSARAQDIALDREAFQAPAQLRFAFDETAERLQAEAWLRRVFPIEQTGDLHRPSPQLQADPRMVRGQELWTVAAFDEASEEFDALLDEARETGDALQSYQLAHYLRDIGAYLSSIVAAADIITAAEVPTLEAPPYLARMRYPAYFADLVQSQAQSYGFDPLLLLALIRQESLFNPNAISVAAAKGLTQVIPSTAQYIAEQLNQDGFQDSDLLRPHVSISFGAYYLDEQLDLFDGNKAAALAAYNAGPGYTLDWVRLSGGDVDSLVNTITFEETQRYVQRIYSHYTIYRELYGVN